MGNTYFERLSILFIGLKLSNYINWDWKLVLLPLYGWPLGAIIVALAMFIRDYIKGGNE